MEERAINFQKCFAKKPVNTNLRKIKKKKKKINKRYDYSIIPT